MSKKNKQQEREGLFNYPANFLDEGLPKGALSPSSFNTYRRCPKQYYYSYVEEIRKAPAITMVKGSVIHKGAEVVHKHTIEHQTLMGIEKALALMSDDFESRKGAIEDWEGVPEGVLKDSALNNFRVYYVNAVPKIKPIAVEKPFVVKIGGVPVRGLIDLIEKVPGEYSLGDNPELPPPNVDIVIDLKTTKKKWAEQKINHEPQMTFYAEAENTENVRIDFLLDQKSGTKYLPVRALRSVNEKRVLTEDVVAAAEFIKKGVFPRCDPTGWNCTPKFCGHYRECRGGC